MGRVPTPAPTPEGFPPDRRPDDDEAELEVRVVEAEVAGVIEVVVEVVAVAAVMEADVAETRGGSWWVWSSRLSRMGRSSVAEKVGDGDGEGESGLETGRSSRSCCMNAPGGLEMESKSRGGTTIPQGQVEVL